MDVGRDSPVERLNEAQTRLRQFEFADDRRIATLEDPDDATLETILERPPLDSDQHAIAVHRLLDVPGRNVDVRRVVGGSVRHDKSESRRMCLKATDNEIHLVGQPDAPAFGLHQFA